MRGPNHFLSLRRAVRGFASYRSRIGRAAPRFAKLIRKFNHNRSLPDLNFFEKNAHEKIKCRIRVSFFG